ncbi:MAG: pyrimidine 5'-nucleotidase [Methylophilaceae bacterium]|nr:pyrimidine 5'-nucleotidase [Methylophilaceae bacterium]
MPQKIWIFDLDDTLHDASSHIFPTMNHAMTQYIVDNIGLDEPAAFALRQHYWRVYGATLKGLMRHHNTNPHHFLHQTHAPLDLKNMVQTTKGLRHFLTKLNVRKVIFTNAPLNYAVRVLELLDIDDLFEIVFSVESTGLHPKPSIRGFRRLLSTLKAKPSNCIMLEDNKKALMTAKRLGIKTVLITKSIKKPSYVDIRVNSVLALTHKII